MIVVKRSLLALLIAAGVLLTVGPVAGGALVLRSALGHRTAASSPTASPSTEAPADDATTSTPPADDGPKDLAWGTGYDATSNNGGAATMTVDSAQVLGSGEYDYTTNGHYIAFQVRYVGVTGSFEYNEFGFDLRGPDGTTYQSTIDTDSTHPALNSGSVYVGSHANGWIFFDAPGTAIGTGGALEVLGGSNGVIGVYRF
jgi:hypothetical protein